MNNFNMGSSSSLDYILFSRESQSKGHAWDPELIKISQGGENGESTKKC